MNAVRTMRPQKPLPRLKRVVRARGEGGIDYCVMFQYHLDGAQEHGVLLAHGMPEQVTDAVRERLLEQVTRIVHAQVDPRAAVCITEISTHAGPEGRRQLPLIS